MGVGRAVRLLGHALQLLEGGQRRLDEAALLLLPAESDDQIAGLVKGFSQARVQQFDMVKR
jgi:hypothetical protein